MHIKSEESAAGAAPRSGAPAPAPFLDKGDRNLPNQSWRPAWTKKQWMTRRAVMDRLRYWQAGGYQCLWVTLTSSPTSPDKRLRGDFQALRKRIERELGFKSLEYVCVDTREGHGVLHMIWAWKDPNPRKRASFYVPFEWLQPAWTSLHGAFHVNVKRIGGADQDARRLSRYIVAQYCGDQNALVRLSQSRMAVPLTKMRAQLLRALKGLPERYEFGGKLLQSVGSEEFSRAFNQFLWLAFRQAWDCLVRSRSCEAYGVTLVWVDGELRRL
jgi:hypothetical protein